jgi:putative nucleotidyltransferase with HDIG domain
MDHTAQQVAEKQAAIFLICLKTHHDATAEHSLRVARCSVVLAKELKLSEAETLSLYYGCLLHDVGKIGVPINVLSKQARLDNEERALVKSHTWKGAAMVHGFFPSDVTRCLNEHHENFDGSGYPSGLKGIDISPLARMCAVVDAFDAITYDREYRVRASYEVALHELVSWSGRQFDPDVVEAFRRVPRDRWFEAANQPYEVLIAA